MEKLAQKHACTIPQLALAWVIHQGDDVAPIPGEQISALFLPLCVCVCVCLYIYIYMLLPKVGLKLLLIY